VLASLDSSQPVGRERICDGSRPGIIQIEYVLQDGPSIENVASS